MTHALILITFPKSNVCVFTKKVSPIRTIVAVDTEERIKIFAEEWSPNNQDMMTDDERDQPSKFEIFKIEE